jgi:hypothetical protein
MKCSEAKKIISDLNLLSLKEADYDEIKSKIGSLLNAGARMEAITFPTGTRIFRGVTHKSKPTTSQLLGYPPADYVTNFQRCNAPLNPMFYCSTDPVVILYELRVKPGDIVYRSKWSVIKPFWMMKVFGAYEGYKADPMIEEAFATSELVTSYFETIFSQLIHETFSYQYKTTAALSELLSKGDMPPEGDEIGAVLYPSMVHPTRAKTQCLAVRPEIVDRCLKLDYVEECLIKRVEGDIIELKASDFADNFDDGAIRWTGRNPTWVIKPGEVRKIARRGYGFELTDLDGNIIDPV